MSTHGCEGQQAVVTGAGGGIGEAITRRLADAGMSVVLVGRDAGRLARAAERVRVARPDARLRVEKADLSLVTEVRALAERLVRDGVPDVVVSNAAVIAALDDVTREGVQRTLATNHLAPYLLLRSLADAVDGRRARFVVVGASPSGLARVPVDLDDLESHDQRALGPVRSLRPFVAYARTKNMNAMFVYALARRMAGTGITVNGAHPGIIAGTDLSRDARGAGRSAERALSTLVNLNPFRKTAAVGADSPAWLATAPELDGVSGRFFVERRATTTATHTTDVARCDRLWELSAELVGMSA